ncbi:TetR/AcrR family transcriptional regulator [Cysteiniphilum litorale]|uniref:TetR/AcrR family transcriptional regulator n=1 Tax=Cysteiniphilum litorale TaxID=2056700 RepID=UPI003F882DC2
MTEKQKGQKKIVNAAKKLFVKKGFDGTSLRDIATKANVPVSLIYHYFENKVHLWQEVKVSLLIDSGWMGDHNLDKDRNFAEFLEHFINMRLQLLYANPDIVRLFDWQRLESGKNQLFGLGNAPEGSKWKTLLDYLEIYRNKGQITSTLSDEAVTSMVFGLILGPFVRTGQAYFKNNDEYSIYKDTITTTLIQTLAIKHIE